MANLGKMLVLAGVALTLVGALCWLLGPKPGSGGGLLPGDLAFRRGGASRFISPSSPAWS